MSFFVYDIDKTLFAPYHFEDNVNFFIMGKDKKPNFPSFECLKNNNYEYFIVPVFLQIENIVFNPKIKDIKSIINKVNSIIENFCLNLKYYKNYKKNHIFFQTGDWDGCFPCLKDSIVFKHSSNYKYPLHYFTDMNLKTISSIDDAQFDVSFKGAISHPIRNNIKQTINNFINNGFNCFYDDKINYWMEQDDDLKIEHKKNYVNLICNSKFILCPRGNAFNSYRFFEALECGRIPILIADDAKLPLENIIKYEDFIVRVPEKDILNSYKYIKKFNKFIELSLPRKYKYFI